MHLIEPLFALGAAPFVEVVAGLTFVLLVAAAALSIAFDAQDESITRDIHRFIHAPRPAKKSRSRDTRRGGHLEPRLARAPT